MKDDTCSLDSGKESSRMRITVDTIEVLGDILGKSDYRCEKRSKKLSCDESGARSEGITKDLRPRW